jgi:hypothetical protein
MWQVMHWLDGMALVKTCFSGWPGSSLGMVGSAVWVVPLLPNWAWGPELARERSFA